MPLPYDHRSLRGPTGRGNPQRLRTTPSTTTMSFRGSKATVGISWYNLSNTNAGTSILPGDCHVGHSPPRNDTKFKEFRVADEQCSPLRFSVIASQFSNWCGNPVWLRTTPSTTTMSFRGSKATVGISWYNLSNTNAGTSILPGDCHVGHSPPRNDTKFKEFRVADEQCSPLRVRSVANRIICNKYSIKCVEFASSAQYNGHRNHREV